MDRRSKRPVCPTPLFDKPATSAGVPRAARQGEVAGRKAPGLAKLVEASSQQQDEQSANDEDGSQQLMGSDLFFKKENRGQEGE